MLSDAEREIHVNDQQQNQNARQRQMHRQPAVEQMVDSPLRVQVAAFIAELFDGVDGGSAHDTV